MKKTKDYILDENGSVMTFVILSIAIIGMLMSAYINSVTNNKKSLTHDYIKSKLSFFHENIRRNFSLAKSCNHNLYGLKPGDKNNIYIKTKSGEILDYSKLNTNAIKVDSINLEGGNHDITANNGHFSDGEINVVYIVNGIRYNKKIPINYKLKSGAISYCYGEKFAELDQLYNEKFLEVRKSVCAKLLEGNIDSNGRCQWKN